MFPQFCLLMYGNEWSRYNMSNTKTSQLDSSQVLGPEDLLLVSRKTSGTHYASYQISAKDLLSQYSKNLESGNQFVVKGEWLFDGDGINGGIFVGPKNPAKPTSVPTLKSVYDSFMEKLRALSAEIYDQPHIPSVVGEIIFSTYLNTLDKVRKKYGQETFWKPINGRFIMTTDSNVGQTAGATNSVLGLSDIPPHSHTLNMETGDLKTLKVNTMVSFKSPSVVVASETLGEPKIPGQKLDGFPIIHDREITNDFAVEGNIMGSEGRPSSECQTVLNGTMTVQRNSGSSKGHNNIPPFYSVYIWRRES